MASGATEPQHAIQYEPDETPPYKIAIGLALQYVVLTIAGIVITVAIVVRAAGGSESYLAWGSFAVLVVSGLTTAVQARRLGRIGAGYILLMGTSGAFIAVSVTALVQGGPGLLATLVIASSLFQFGLSWKLALLRRIITPVVAGTVIMLIAVTIMPLLFELLRQVPEGSSSAAAPMTALATVLVTLLIVLRASGVLRLWGPVIGIVVGCAVAVSFGIYDFGRVAEARWFGLPAGGWPGFDFSFGPAFWTLLPTFVFVTLIGAVETVGDGVAIQRVSWRKKRATDFGAVQGAVAADGLGNLLSGLLGTVPNTTYSSSISLVEITGVAARRVGICIGVTFCLLAFLPKVAAVVLAVPDPVIAAYAIVLISILFVIGMRVVIQDGIDYRTATIVGVSFWAGVGFQEGVFFTESLGPQLAPLLENGMTAGGLVAILLTLVLELLGSRPMRVDTTLNVEALPAIRNFLDKFSIRRKWQMEMSDRLLQAAEETLLILLEQTGGVEDAEEGARDRRLRLVARKWGTGAELEFIAAGGEGNIEDQIAVLASHGTEEPQEHELSLRILRHLATSVRHQKYHGADIVTVNIEGPRGG
ncbi:uracil-xanthine permease family protein [Candidatus Palauibacter sp.]|uniref:uracil-xanthine permease family protein n=1 Tax=Candidatus Palauibacter sp. TaxID=3101350 RepID=UPI003B52FEB3